MITIELSSVHLNFNRDICDIITHSIFSDGMSVTILSSCSNNITPKLYILDSFNYVINNSQHGIIISLDNNSITCKLSKHLPKFINDNIGNALKLFLDRNNLTIKDIDFWAVHPGGKRILESVESGLNLSRDQLTVSWDILNTYGNMLSSSIMFVLEKFISMENIKKDNSYCVAFSFSPGVGIEFILLKKDEILK
jgi:alpha-pyrone synthase